MAISEQIRAGIRKVYLPPHDVVLPGIDMSNISEEQNAAYKAWCDLEIKKQLIAVKAENDIRRANWPTDMEMPEYVLTDMVCTQYPYDDSASEDVVTMGDNGDLVILDSGSR